MNLDHVEALLRPRSPHKPTDFRPRLGGAIERRRECLPGLLIPSPQPGSCGPPVDGLGFRDEFVEVHHRCDRFPPL